MNIKLLNELRKIMNKHDPIGIYFGKDTNFDEYDPEIKDIYTQFKKCKSGDEFVVKVHNIFIKWFSVKVAGNKGKYTELSKDLFNLLNKNIVTAN